jgi:hypothetical protein
MNDVIPFMVFCLLSRFKVYALWSQNCLPPLPGGGMSFMDDPLMLFLCFSTVSVDMNLKRTALFF